jgi:hypothetical protein
MKEREAVLTAREKKRVVDGADMVADVGPQVAEVQLCITGIGKQVEKVDTSRYDR